MEKRSISGKDILRMDGLLPPTRRLPVCDAVPSSDKKKEKKWFFGGLLSRISSIRDNDSSSNDEEIVYCTRQPRSRTVFNRKSHNVVLHPVDESSNQHLNSNISDAAGKSMDTSSLQKDSVHSRSSDGSLEGLSKRARKSKFKARIEAMRDHICANSSSDEDSRISSNSLARYQNELATQGTQKNSSSNKKSRAARTERYIKRLSRDDAPKFPEDLNNIANKRNSLDFINEEQSYATIVRGGLPPFSQQPARVANYSTSNTFPVQRSVENPRQPGGFASNHQVRSSMDLVKTPAGQYITDLNQNTYAKPKILQKNKNLINQKESSYFSNTPTTSTNYAEPRGCTKNRHSACQSSSPPAPPPRDPRCRMVGYNCNSFPFNGKYNLTRYDDTLRAKVNDIHEVTKEHLKSLRSYESNNEINWYGSPKQYPRRPLSLTMEPAQCCDSSACTNNRHNSTGKHVDDATFKETEEMKCQRRNDRNDQLTSSFKDYDSKNKSSTYIENMKNKNTASPGSSKSLDSPYTGSPVRQIIQNHSYDPSNDISSVSPKLEDPKDERTPSDQEKERRRSSKNLEEALSELEAIYNSLRLGDEDLLDRAERRSMEEFSLRRAQAESVPLIAEDFEADRSKDDMAYRRMHPKERPTSLTDAVGQSVLSNISYLIASPLLSHKDSDEDYLYSAAYPARRNEPDVTRDDVVYRSIHRANNTLKVADPQPPFGIPLGPVTTATESDYLHTTPTKPEDPRSLYIPQREPDIVTDDLAYRTLRKDANSTKNSVESKRDQEGSFGTKKKRAVRSLSANLYGLINQDRIHLRREPSLQDINDEISNGFVDIESLPARTSRRVVSDGELSDYDTRRRGDRLSKSTNTDINGNHPVGNVHRKKLRVYVPPSSKVQGLVDENEKDGKAATVAAPSNDILSRALSNDFWQETPQTRSEDLAGQDTESDFTTYSRLCQDLVNLIEGHSDAETKRTEEATGSRNTDETEVPAILRIQSLGSHYTQNGDGGVKENADTESIEKLTESLTKAEREDSGMTDDKTFDFYLRVADENVKLIAEAFSSVADHLRDSRLSQKNSLTSQRSEIDTDSSPLNTSTRSSVTYSLDDTNDDLSSSSKATDTLHVVPKEEATINVKQEDHEVEERLEEAKVHSNTDPELDLTKAVHDLQLAAASLCRHEKEFEELEALLKKDSCNSVSDVRNVEDIKEDSTVDFECNSVPRNGEMGREHPATEETIIPTDDKLRTDECDPNCEGESTECKDTCESYDNARSTEIRISYVTNLITVLITTYSMVLLACFLALLLATVAAS